MLKSEPLLAGGSGGGVERDDSGFDAVLEWLAIFLFGLTGLFGFSAVERRRAS